MLTANDPDREAREAFARDRSDRIGSRPVPSETGSGWRGEAVQSEWEIFRRGFRAALPAARRPDAGLRVTEEAVNALIERRYGVSWNAASERTQAIRRAEAKQELTAALPHLRPDAGRSDEIEAAYKRGWNDREGDILERAASVLPADAGRDEKDARIAALEAALKPFADAYEDEQAEDRWELWERPEAMNITVGDLKRAYKALDAGRDDDKDARIAKLETIIREMVRLSPDNPDVEDVALTMFDSDRAARPDEEKADAERFRWLLSRAGLTCPDEGGVVKEIRWSVEVNETNVLTINLRAAIDADRARAGDTT